MRDPPIAAALCDGAGNAEGSAKKILSLFQKLIRAAAVEDISKFDTWNKWSRLLDTSLSGGNQSTFVAVASLENGYVGTCIGDSRVYKVTRDGKIVILTEGAAKYRLGSGEIKPLAIHEGFENTKMLMLMSDGAWGPLNLYKLQKLIIKMTFNHLSDLPNAILDEASRYGRGDDMTVVVIQRK